MNYKRYLILLLISMLLLGQSAFAAKSKKKVAEQKKTEQRMSIDLASALRLLDKQNTELAIQLEKVKQAEIARSMAWYQWLPTIRAGGGYAWQDGPLQNTNGSIQNVERNARSSGLGVGGTGSGIPSRPGVSLELDLADALYQPLVTKQRLKAARATEDSTRRNTTLQVASAYYNLVKAKRGMILSNQALDK